MASGERRSRNARAPGGRGSGFTQQETDNLLELLIEHLPLCRDEWETVLRLHRDRYPGVERSVDSIRRKFGALHRKRVPTGDPNIPPDVEKAKRVRQKKAERADSGDAEFTEDILQELIPDHSSGSGIAPIFWTDDETEGAGALTTVNEREEQGSEDARAFASTSADIEVEGTQNNTAALPSLNSRGMSPRPLVRKRSSLPGDVPKSGVDDILSLIKMSMLQDQTPRADELAQRELDKLEERQNRAEERRRKEQDRVDEIARREEERSRREAESRRHEQFMQIIPLSLTQSSQKRSKDVPDTDPEP